MKTQKYINVPTPRGYVTASADNQKDAVMAELPHLQALTHLPKWQNAWKPPMTDDVHWPHNDISQQMLAAGLLWSLAVEA